MGNTHSNSPPRRTPLPRAHPPVSRTHAAKTEISTRPQSPVPSSTLTVSPSQRPVSSNTIDIPPAKLIDNSVEEFQKLEEETFSGTGSLASSFNESDLLAETIAAEPTSYKNSNKIVHDFGVGGVSALTSVDAKESDKDKGIPTIITWSQGGNNVCVTGTFNDWKHNIRLCKSTSDFTTVINLPPGTHKLKFIVDDEWKCSNELETATDSNGDLVNYLEVFEEEENELPNDELDVDAPGGLRCGTPPGDYSSHIPDYLLAYERSLVESENPEDDDAPDDLSDAGECIDARPPLLPPHLERVILNSSSASKDDNSSLPVPNHVVLNHLYACSIRDGVMAVASTTRYRKKYVTTVLYKPVFS
ncbi:10231_t:CDS:2 [Paraglomus brasilianum]|uniref:10231_t:CDS:1 n=1 Tax=Paraglomus brasilianum TaxID=144538 RepID=A0A9N9G134_9GLOM|nr:10231_t:CDS:2 [Paraglomus brasilianum]